MTNYNKQWWKVSIGADSDYFMNTIPPVLTDDNQDLGSVNRTLRVRWYPSDSKDAYDPVDNLYQEDSFDYDLNSHGFRCDEFEYLHNSAYKKLMVFGCSNTFGTGLPERDSWSNIVRDGLEAKLNEKVELINLGMPGSSSDDLIRIISMLENKFNPDFICCYTPPTFRKTLINGEGNLYNFLLSNEYNPEFHNEEWKKMTDICFTLFDIAPENFHYSEYVAERMVKTYASLVSAKCAIITTRTYLDHIHDTYKEGTGPKQSLARDKAHWGPHFHQHLALEFLKILNND